MKNYTVKTIYHGPYLVETEKSNVHNKVSKSSMLYVNVKDYRSDITSICVPIKKSTVHIYPILMVRLSQ